jgi:hypothetical protein
MHSKNSRRDFLKLSFAAAALPFAGKLSAATPPARSAGDEAAGLTVYELGPQLWIRFNNRPLTCYRAHRSQKYPYMYPLAGPASGQPLTDETTLPYPHHRSLFFGCDKVNGGNYWQEGFETGQILSQGPKLGRVDKSSVEILDTCDWQKPGGPLVMRDRRKITVSVPNDRVHFVDWEIDWQAVQDVVIERTNHSLFSMRAALDITPKAGGNLVNADGQAGEKATAGKPSKWCAFYGKRPSAAGQPVEGIAIMDHSANPWAPTPWFTRDYGFASPTPMYWNEKSWQLAAGKSVKLRYRVVLFAGEPKQAGLDQIYSAWTQT